MHIGEVVYFVLPSEFPDTYGEIRPAIYMGKEPRNPGVHFINVFTKGDFEDRRLEGKVTKGVLVPMKVLKGDITLPIVPGQFYTAQELGTMGR